MAQPFALHPLFQHPPQGQAQKAHESVRCHPFGFLVADRAQTQIAFADANGVFGLGQLPLPTPAFGGVCLRAVGAQQIRAVRVGGPGDPFGPPGDGQSARPALLVALEEDFAAPLNDSGVLGRRALEGAWVLSSWARRRSR